MKAYFFLGIQHIMDINAYDHMLFIALLIVPIPIREWKKIVWLLTSFTVGHSVTLALTVAGFNLIEPSWVEFLIPMTILGTGLANLISKERKMRSYLVASLFGLIHGMGFAGYLISLLPSSSIWQPLLFFNLGVEAGQLVFSTIFVLSLFLYQQYSPFKTHQTVRTSINIGGIAISLFLAAQNWPL